MTKVRRSAYLAARIATKKIYLRETESVKGGTLRRSHTLSSRRGRAGAWCLVSSERTLLGFRVPGRGDLSSSGQIQRLGKSGEQGGSPFTKLHSPALEGESAVVAYPISSTRVAHPSCAGPSLYSTEWRRIRKSFAVTTE